MTVKSREVRELKGEAASMGADTLFMGVVTRVDLIVDVPIDVVESDQFIVFDQLLLRFRGVKCAIVLNFGVDIGM